MEEINATSQKNIVEIANNDFLTIDDYLDALRIELPAIKSLPKKH